MRIILLPFIFENLGKRLDYFVFKKKNIRLIYNMSVVLLKSSDDVATLEIDQPRTRDAVDESKIFLLLSFNERFAGTVNTMCKNTNPADYTLELFVVVNNVLSILDITPAVETYLLTNANVDSGSSIKISIDNFGLGVTGFVEFHTIYNDNTYELYSNQLQVKHSTKPSKPVFTPNESFGTPDGTTIVLQSCPINTAADGYSNITQLTVIWTEISNTSPEIIILRVPYSYDNNQYVFSNSANGTSLREGILYKMNVFYTNSVGRSVLSEQIQLRVGGLPNEVSVFEAKMSMTRDGTTGIATTTMDLDVQYPTGSAPLGAFYNDDVVLDNDTIITSFKIWAKSGSSDYSLLIEELVNTNTTVGNHIYFKLSPTTLVQGTNYDIKVTAVSNLGEGVLADAAIVGITYCGAAGKVTELTATSSDLNPEILTLAWVRPVDLGGVPFSKYYIKAGSNEYYTTDPFITIANSDSDSTNVASNPSLVSGTAFPVTVITMTEENSNDDFEGSSTDVIAYPSRQPTNPTSFVIDSLDNSVKLLWSSDSNLFNLDFVSYSINISKEGNTVATNDITNQSTLEYTFIGLQNDGMYTVKFHVLTKNLLNDSQHSSNDARTYNFWPFVKPSKPLNVTAVTDLNYLPNINVAWDTPSNATSSGCAINKYTIVRTGDDATVSDIDVDDLIRSYTDTSGNKGVTYTYVVTATATNPNGSLSNVIGESSESSGFATAFVEPTALASSMLQTPDASNNQITLNWSSDPNAEVCGLPTVGYHLREGSSSAVLATVLATSNLTYTFAGLTNVTSYTYNISPYVVYNMVEVESTSSTSFYASTPYTNPDPVTLLTCASSTTSTNPSNTLTWTLPTNTGGFPISSMQIYKSSTGPDSPSVMITLSAVDASFTDFNVIIGYSYTYSVEVSTTAVAIGLADVQMNSTKPLVTGIPCAPPVIDSLVLDLSKNIVVTMTQNGSQVFDYLMFAVPVSATSAAQAEIIKDAHPNPETPLTLDNASVTFIIDATAESFAEVIVVVSSAVGMGFKSQSFE